MNVTMQLAETYLERLKARRSPSEHTVRAYRSDLRDYVAFVQTQPEANPAPILSYVSHLTDTRGMTIRTTRRRVSCLRGFYADLARTKVIELSPFRALEVQLPRVKSLPRALAREDAGKLARASWTACGPDMDGDRHLGLAILLLLSVGLRVGELVALRPSDLDAADGGLHVRGKGRRERRVPLVDFELRRQLGAIMVPDAATLFNAAHGGWTTQSFRQRLCTFARSAGVSRRVTPHMLRHTCATLLLEDGVDLLFLQRLLGHENIATTALYAHVGDASLKRALEKASLLTSLAA